MSDGWVWQKRQKERQWVWERSPTNGRGSGRKNQRMFLTSETFPSAEWLGQPVSILNVQSVRMGKRREGEKVASGGRRSGKERISHSERGFLTLTPLTRAGERNFQRKEFALNSDDDPSPLFLFLHIYNTGCLTGTTTNTRIRCVRCAIDISISSFNWPPFSFAYLLCCLRNTECISDR